MRRLTVLLALLPCTALAQPVPAPMPQQEAPVLYPYKKSQLPPGAFYEPGNAGIPTSGTAQARQLESGRPGYRPGGPTVIQRHEGKKGATTVITGPGGTTVCADSYGRRGSTTVCY